MERISYHNGQLIVPDHVKISYIVGDGIGKDIWPAAQEVFDTAMRIVWKGQRTVTWDEVLAGEKAFEATGSYLPEESIAQLKESVVSLKGPLTTPVGEGIRSINVTLRQTLDLYNCMRPVRWFKGVESPVKRPDLVNMVIFRENTEDIYAGIEWMQGTPEATKFRDFLINEMGVKSIRFPETSSFGVKPVSIEGTERLMDAALQFAFTNYKPSITIVHKGNIMKYTEGGFKNWAYAYAQKTYPDKVFCMPTYHKIRKEQGEEAAKQALAKAKADKLVIIKDDIADAFLQNSLLYPENYSVIATLNLNGDYISDHLAAMVGGIGIAPGGNINNQNGYAIFEATHGTAPDIAGKNIANPISLILSGAMMFKYLNFDIYMIIEEAVGACIRRKVVTHDLAQMIPGAKALGTKEFAHEVAIMIELISKGISNEYKPPLHL